MRGWSKLVAQYQTLQSISISVRQQDTGVMMISRPLGILCSLGNSPIRLPVRLNLDKGNGMPMIELKADEDSNPQ
jgi:hypothetical protein